MERYKNIAGDSGVIEYQIGADFIRVRFRTGATYLYTFASAGQANVEQMKALAHQGYGLNAFINTTVRNLYDKKE